MGTLSHNPQQNSVKQSDKHRVSFKFITPKKAIENGRN